MHSSLELFRQTAEQLEKLYGTQEAQSLSFLLLEDLYKLSRTEILAGKPVKESVPKELLDQYIYRLNQSEPIQYILGHTTFYDLSLKVNPSVLIPRPETEELVHLIISENKNTVPLSILDIGTGSGCIPIALKKNIPHAELYALDISEAALQTAQENARLYQTEIQWLQADIRSGETKIPDTNIIVSNPPYVTRAEQALMHPNVLNHEPWLALFVEDHDPLLFYKAIAGKAIRHLLPNGKLYFEINEQFGEETAQLLLSEGFTEVHILKDLQGKDRIVKGQKPRE